MDELLGGIGADLLPEVLEAVHCRQEINRISEMVECCGDKALISEPAPDGSKHYRKAVCGSCGKFHGWIRKPQNLVRRAASTTGLAKGDFCSLCLRTSNLEVHHIIEIQDGGSNSADNLMTVCAGCHALIHWLRQYKAA